MDKRSDSTERFLQRINNQKSILKPDPQLSLVAE